MLTSYSAHFAYRASFYAFSRNEDKKHNTLTDVLQLVESLDLRHTLEHFKNIKYADDIILCLRALLEQVDRLDVQYKNMWFVGEYRIGNQRTLYNDILTQHQKLSWRLSFYSFAKPVE